MNHIATSKPITIGQLARRTGMSIRALREYEAMGLLYGLGRSEGNYRLFDESTMWCLRMIQTLRSLGLTLKEIQQITVLYCRHRAEPLGPHLRDQLDQALERVEARISELRETRRRIHDFKTTYAAALAGTADLELYAEDPRRQELEAAS